MVISRNLLTYHVWSSSVLREKCWNRQQDNFLAHLFQFFSHNYSTIWHHITYALEEALLNIPRHLQTWRSLICWHCRWWICRSVARLISENQKLNGCGICTGVHGNRGHTLYIVLLAFIGA